MVTRGDLSVQANLRRQAVYAVHLTAGGTGFDYVSEFHVTMPILSFTTLRETHEDTGREVGAGAGSGSLQLYCMQTQAGPDIVHGSRVVW